MSYTTQLKFNHERLSSKFNNLENFLNKIKYFVLAEYIVSTVPVLWFILEATIKNGPDRILYTLFYGSILLFIPKLLIRTVVTATYVSRKLRCSHDDALYFINNNSSFLAIPKSLDYYQALCINFAATHKLYSDGRFFYTYTQFVEYQSDDALDREEERRKHLKAVMSVVNSDTIVGTSEIYRTEIPELINLAANKRDPLGRLALLYTLQSYN